MLCPIPTNGASGPLHRSRPVDAVRSMIAIRGKGKLSHRIRIQRLNDDISILDPRLHAHLLLPFHASDDLRLPMTVDTCIRSITWIHLVFGSWRRRYGVVSLTMGDWTWRSILVWIKSPIFYENSVRQADVSRARVSESTCRHHCTGIIVVAL